MPSGLKKSRNFNKQARRAPLVLLFLLIAAIIAADRFLDFGLNGFDYAALVILALFALKGYVQGLVNTVFSLLGYAAGILGAILLGSPAASLLMSRTGLGEVLSGRLGTLSPKLQSISVKPPDATGQIENAGRWLENHTEALTALEGHPMLEQILRTSNMALPDAEKLQAPVTNLEELLVWSLLRIGAMFMLFLIIKLLLVLAGKGLTSMMDLSATLGTANRTGGMLLGLLAGLAIVYVVMGLILPFLGSLQLVKIPGTLEESGLVKLYQNLFALCAEWRK